MATERLITSAANPLVKQTARLREARARRRTGLLIAEGLREVSRALEAGLSLRQVFVCPDRLDATGAREAVQRLLATLDKAVRVVHVSTSVLGKLAYRSEPEGVLAVAEQPTWSLQDLEKIQGQPLFLVAVGIEKPGNLGAMVRTASAAGCDAVLCAGGRVDAFNPNAIRSSTAAVFGMPIVSADEELILGFLERHGIRLAVATPVGGTSHTQADLRGPLAIVIGREETGLDERWLAAAQKRGGVRVMIPMQGGLVDSLNASASAAVLLFEARRQRGQG